MRFIISSGLKSFINFFQFSIKLLLSLFSKSCYSVSNSSFIVFSFYSVVYDIKLSIYFFLFFFLKKKIYQTKKKKKNSKIKELFSLIFHSLVKYFCFCFYHYLFSDFPILILPIFLLKLNYL